MEQKEAAAVAPSVAAELVAAAAAVKRAGLSSSASSPELASLTSLLPQHDDNDAASLAASHAAAPSSSVRSVWSLCEFVLGELVDVDSSGSSSRPSSSPRALVYNFLILPYFLERLLGTGSAVCTDCFLYLFTVLPFRMCALLLRSLLWPFSRRSLRTSAPSSSLLADVLRFVLLLLSWYCLSLLPMSRLYHYIRGQSVLKLYVLFNMLQISDRLFASIGEDILDALFSSLHLPPPYLLFHLAISAAYTTLHALLLFAQVITLNVSVNSDNSSLFILLVSNNFVELKSAVFKRFDAHNLFQIACSDVVERFQLVLFLLLITVMNVSHLGVEVAWEAGWLQKAAVMSVMVLGGEMVVDWIKHGFICKFNMISPRVYRQYAEIIQHDFVQAHFAQSSTPGAATAGAVHVQSASTLSSSTAPSTSSSSTGGGKSSSAHSVTRRLGLSSLPLAVLVLRVVGSTFQHSSGASPAISVSWLPFELSVESALKATVLLLTFAVLTVLKLLISVSLLGRIAQQALRDKIVQVSRSTEESSAADRSKEQQWANSTAAKDGRAAEALDEADLSWIKEEQKEGSSEAAVKAESVVSENRVKSEEEEEQEEEEGENRGAAKRIGVKRDGLIILTQLVHPARTTPLPGPLLETGPLDPLPYSHSHTSHSQSAAAAAGPSTDSFHSHPHSRHLPLSVDTADLSRLSSSPCQSPSSSSSASSTALCLPVAHDGDLVPAHDRVGSVDLLAPSPELFTQLVSIDRYRMSTTNIPP